MKRICKFCNKDFDAKLKEINRGGGKFCTHRCYTLWNCGENNGKYCSRKCAAGGGEVKRICEICEKVFYVPPRTLRRDGGKYCSKSCFAESLKYSSLGNNNPNWIDGRSFEPYTLDFNQQLKDRIRVRDNFICQKCGVPELECDTRLAIHHIDYNKKNCEEDNLISLCNSCNGKVNANREHWTKYFQKTMQGVN